MSFAEQLQECPYCGQESRSRGRRSTITSPNWAKGTEKKDPASPASSEGDMDTPWKPDSYEAVDYRRTFLLLLLLVVSALAYMMYDLVNEDKGSEYARMEWCTQYCNNELDDASDLDPTIDSNQFTVTCRATCIREHGLR
jgi:hypothetical protein